LASPAFAWTPVVGWTAEAAYAFSALVAPGLPPTALTAAWSPAAVGAVFTGLNLAVGAAAFAWLRTRKLDFYEDAVVASQSAADRLRLVAEGQIQQEAWSKRRFRVGRTGLGGFGAAAFFHKHLRESLRANRLGLWGAGSVALVILAAGAAALLAWGGRAEQALPIILAGLMAIQSLRMGMGRGMKELYTYYLYLVPEPSLAKIVWSNLEAVVKALVEGVAIFAAVALICRAAPLPAALAAAAFTTYNCFVVAAYCLAARIVGANPSPTLVMAVYAGLMALGIGPGGANGQAVGVLAGGRGSGLGWSFAILAVWQAAAALAACVLSRGALDRPEIARVPGTG
jgi:hypothetical protein